MMGACTSSPDASSNDTITHQYPPWCILNPIITDVHIKFVQHSWNRLMNGDSKAHARAHKEDPNLTPLTFFYNTFYNHLFDWLPQSKSMLTHGMHLQGNMLV